MTDSPHPTRRGGDDAVEPLDLPEAPERMGGAASFLDAGRSTATPAAIGMATPTLALAIAFSV